MPQAIDLVLKNAAATNKTFSLYSPAAGYGGVAEWRLKEGTIASVFPVVTAQARKTGNRSARTQVKLKIPASYTDTVTGLTKVASAFEFDGYATMPDDFPEALKNDCVAFVADLVSNALVKAMFRDGQPAT